VQETRLWPSGGIDLTKHADGLSTAVTAPCLSKADRFATPFTRTDETRKSTRRYLSQLVTIAFSSNSEKGNPRRRRIFPPNHVGCMTEFATHYSNLYTVEGLGINAIVVVKNNKGDSEVISAIFI
jgi:hypothetical protein